jgi:hypothetical protein
MTKFERQISEKMNLAYNAINITEQAMELLTAEIKTKYPEIKACISTTGIVFQDENDSNLEFYDYKSIVEHYGSREYESDNL